MLAISILDFYAIGIRYDYLEHDRVYILIQETPEMWRSVKYGTYYQVRIENDGKIHTDGAGCSIPEISNRVCGGYVLLIIN